MSVTIYGQDTPGKYATSEANTTGIFSGGTLPSAFSVSLWVKNVSASTNFCGLYADGDHTEYDGCRVNTIGAVSESRFRTVAGAGAQSADSGVGALNPATNWVLMVFVKASSTSRTAYVEGSSTTEGAGTTDLSPSGCDSLIIGGYTPSALCASMEIAEIGIWNSG